MSTYETFSSGWAVRLKSQKVDLEDCIRMLRPPHDPTVHRISAEEVVLRSKEFEGFSDPAEIRGKVEILVARLNGAMALDFNSQPLSIGEVIEYAEGGGRRFHLLFVETAQIRFHTSVTLTVIGANGEPVPAEPRMSMPQEWLTRANADLIVADMLEHYGRADNWFDIYKIVELAENAVGGEKTSAWPG